MTYSRAEYLDYLIDGHRPEVQAAIRAAFAAAEDYDNDTTTDDITPILQLAQVLAFGGTPGVAAVVSAIGAAVGMLARGQRRRRRRIAVRRRNGMASGLMAYRASRLAGQYGVRSGR